MTKVELFDSKLQDIAALFKSLSHPARLAILKYLAESKICMSGDISEELPLSRTTVHQHLSELKKMDLIKGEIDGVKTNYCINQERINLVNSMLSAFLGDINCCYSNNDNC